MWDYFVNNPGKLIAVAWVVAFLFSALCWVAVASIFWATGVLFCKLAGLA